MSLVFIAAFFVSLVVVAVALALGTKSWVVLGVPAALGIAPFAFRHPQAILLGMIALIPIDVLAVLPGQGGAALTVTKLLFPTALGILMLRFLVQHDRSVSLHALDRWVLFWALYNALGVFLAADRATATTELRRSLSMWLFYWVLSRAFVDPAWQRRLLNVVKWSVAISVLIGIQTYISGKNPFSTMTMEGKTLLRITGASSSTPNLFATFLLFPLAISLYQLVQGRRRQRFWALAGVGLMITGLVLTFSRSAFLVMATMLALFVVLAWKRIPAWWLAAGVFLVVCSLPFIPSQYWARMGTLFAFDTSGQEDISLWRRSNYLRVGMRILEERPIFGAGPGNFRVLHAMAEYQPEPSLIGTERVAHNMYLTVLTEGGIVGALIFGGLLYTALRSAFRLRRMPGEVGIHSAATLLSLAGMLMLGMFQVMSLNKYLWLLIALVRALSERSRRELAAWAYTARAMQAQAQAAADAPDATLPVPSPASPSDVQLGWLAAIERGMGGGGSGQR